MKNLCPLMRTCASPAASTISIQHPIAWHTAVTLPSVVTDVLAYFAVSFAMLASETRWLAEIGAPSFTVVEAGAGAEEAGAFDSHPPAARQVGMARRSRAT